MAELPTGTVTFLFTDIEGSTALWEQHRDAMRQALVRHDALVEQIVADHDGHVVRPRGEGDSRFAVFARATDAVAAAAALQQALHAEPWPTPTPLRVRMALHTGEADLRDGDYYGSAVNRCARLRAVAHGGQTLVSLTTEQLVRGQLAGGVGLRDLGEHRLKDLHHPERIFQLGIEGLPADFPPVKTLDTRPNNLPLQPTSFIGREDEIAAARQRLRDPQVRLLTLTGAGGSGKTRLALQVAAELLEDFPDGVWLVELAPTHDPALVTSAIAAALGVKESGTLPLIESLKLSLHTKHLLLVLDNFEQVLAAAPQVAELLSTAPAVKVLVTSRARLQLRGEREVAVPPLALPLLTALPSLAALEEVTAVHLFVERARDARADFLLTATNAPAIAEICVRLDGLPLAIELAAARSKMLAPQALLSRLDHRLKLLTGGAHDLPTRQQTLRGTIDWSFSLLEAAEQRLFTQLGVFVGGWTVEAAEAVCNGDDDLGLDVLDGLQSLLDKSLLRQVEAADGEPRLTMLETIREYAVEQLQGSAEGQAIRQRHTQFYLQLATRAEVELTAQDQERWLTWLETEHDNLRAAVLWSRTHPDGGALELQLVGALWRFWWLRGHLSEGRRWLEEALEHSNSEGAGARAKALLGAAVPAILQSDYAPARARLTECVGLLRSSGNPQTLLEALSRLGLIAHYQGDDVAAQAAWADCIALCEAAGDARSLAEAQMLRSKLAQHQDTVLATRLAEEGIALARTAGDIDTLATRLCLLSEMLLRLGMHVRATRLLTESLSVYRSVEDGPGVAWALLNLGVAAREEGNARQARAALLDGLTQFWGLGQKRDCVLCLEGLASVLVAEGETHRAVRLFGAVSGVRDRIGAPRLWDDDPGYDRAVALARAQLDERIWEETWAEGRAMTLEQAVAYALEEMPDG